MPFHPCTHKNGTLWEYYCGGIVAAGGPKLMFNIVHMDVLLVGIAPPYAKSYDMKITHACLLS